MGGGIHVPCMFHVMWSCPCRWIREQRGSMPLFKSSPKSPQDLVKNLRDALQVLTTTEGGGKKSDKVYSGSSSSSSSSSDSG